MMALSHRALALQPEISRAVWHNHRHTQVDEGPAGPSIGISRPRCRLISPRPPLGLAFLIIGTRISRSLARRFPMRPCPTLLFRDQEDAQPPLPVIAITRSGLLRAYGASSTRPERQPRGCRRHHTCRDAGRSDYPLQSRTSETVPVGGLRLATRFEAGWPNPRLPRSSPQCRVLCVPPHQFALLSITADCRTRRLLAGRGPVASRSGVGF